MVALGNYEACGRGCMHCWLLLLLVIWLVVAAATVIYCPPLCCALETRAITFCGHALHAITSNMPAPRKRCKLTHVCTYVCESVCVCECAFAETLPETQVHICLRTHIHISIDNFRYFKGEVEGEGKLLLLLLDFLFL